MNKENLTKTIINSSKQFTDDPFNHPILLISLFVITLLMMGIVFYKYYTDESNLLIPGKSYYGKDISSYTPLFKIETPKIDKCKKRCLKDALCDGITYNYDSHLCMGTKDGKLRDEGASYISWLKNRQNKPINVETGMMFGFSDTFKMIKNGDFIEPKFLGEFSYSFNIIIYDFYHNFGNWKHIFHKGTNIPIDEKEPFNFKNWENIVSKYPDQCIGVWLAPYTNNLRIAVTTISQESKLENNHINAFIQKCNNLTDECYITDSNQDFKENILTDGSVPDSYIYKNIEYIEYDLQNIPINKYVNITITSKDKTLELYIDGKLSKVYTLSGLPEFNNGHFFSKAEKSFNGDLTNFYYFPVKIGKTEIDKIMKIKSKI